MLIDTHCHLFMPALKNRLDMVLARAREAGIERIIVPALNAETANSAQMLADAYEELYFAVGYHPTEVDESTSLDEIKKTIYAVKGHKKLVAIGEIGLDFRHRRYPESLANPSAMESAQIKAFSFQVELAEELNLPIIIHNRDAGKEILSVISAHPDSFGVFHAFDGSKKTLEFIKSRNFFVSVAGNITYRGASALRASLKLIPEDRLLLETDAPFMAPEPFRGQTSEPCHLRVTLKKVAEILAKSEESITILAGSNSYRLFGF